MGFNSGFKGLMANYIVC